MQVNVWTVTAAAAATCLATGHGQLRSDRDGKPLCFVIFTSEASKLMLSADDEVTTAYGVTDETGYFALH